MYMFTPASALSYRGASYIRLGLVSGQRDSLSLPSQGHPKLKKSNGRQFKKCCPFKKIRFPSCHSTECVFCGHSFSVIARCGQRKVSHVWVKREFRVSFGLSSICLCHDHLQKVCVTNATRVLWHPQERNNLVKWSSVYAQIFSSVISRNWA